MPSIASIASALLAHEGGWDEILLIAGPILVVVGLLALARKRVGDGVDSGHDTPHDSPHDSPHDGSPGPR